MSGIMCSLVGGSGFFPLSMVVGSRNNNKTGGTSYGYSTGSYGTLTPTTFPPSITQTVYGIYYSDLLNMYMLALSTTTTNSGWNRITINGLTLLRTSATFSSGLWTWAAPDSGAALTGAIGSTVEVTFS